MTGKPNWKIIINILRQRVKETLLPSVSLIAGKDPDPFKILISTMISLRTKDAVTLKASKKLFKIAATPEQIASLTQKTIADLIFPAGFYRTKAKNIKKVSEILLEEYNGKVPKLQTELLKFPGVGLKTANLTLNLGYNIDLICVDTHVHRISNRTGWVKTKTPEETEKSLMKILPKKYWKEINELLVTYGQQVCTPVSPFCSTCPIAENCSGTGVTSSR